MKWWHKFLSRKFLVAVAALAAVVASLWFGVDEALMQEYGDKAIKIILALAGLYIGGETAIDITRTLQGK